MRSVVAAFCAAHVWLGHAGRLSTVDTEATALDVGEEAEEEMVTDEAEFESEQEVEEAEGEWGGGDGYGRGFFRKYKTWDAKAAQQQFSSAGERIIVEGEEVEMAWKKGENDVLMFTNKRILHVDAKMNFNNINKKRYTSSLWRTMGSWAIKTVDDIADNDCELEIFDNFVAGRPDVFNFEMNGIPISVEHKFSPVRLGMWHIDFLALKHGDEEGGVDIFEVNAYVERKINEAKAWQKKNAIGVQIAASRMWASANRHNIPGRLSKLKQISAGAGAKEMNRLGQLMSGNERILYAFKESKKIGKQDVVVITDQRVVLADYRRDYSDAKVKFWSVPFDDEPMQMVNSWEFEQAGKIADRDGEVEIGTITGEKFHASLHKKYTSQGDMIDMYYQLSKQILKEE